MTLGAVVAPEEEEEDDDDDAEDDDEDDDNDDSGPDASGRFLFGWCDESQSKRRSRISSTGHEWTVTTTKDDVEPFLVWGRDDCNPNAK